MKKLLWIFSRAYQKFNADRCPLLASALVHATTFSLFPLLLALISLSVFILGSSEAVIDKLMPIFQQVFPVGIDSLLRNIVAIRQTSIVLVIIGFIGFTWATASVFRAIESSLNVIWKVKRDRPFFRKSLITIGSAYVVFIGLLATLGLTVWGSTVGATGVGRFLPEISFVASTALFGLIYRFFPNRTVRWREAFFGALFTGVFWELAKFLFSFYMFRVVDYSKIYGSLSTIIILFLWVYYSAYIFLFGAELSYVYARRKRLK